MDVHRANIRNKLGITGMHELMLLRCIGRKMNDWQRKCRSSAENAAHSCWSRTTKWMSLSVKRALKELRAETPWWSLQTARKPLEHLRSKTGLRPFLIVLDINLPRMNGAEFLKSYVKTPALCLSSCRGPDQFAPRGGQGTNLQPGVTGYFCEANHLA